MITLGPRARILFRGDSNTQGTNGPISTAPFIQAVRASYMRATAPSIVAGTGSAPSGSGIALYDWGAPIGINQGTAGETSSQAYTTRATRIFPYNPDLVVHLFETNDVDPGSGITVPDWKQNCGDFYDAITNPANYSRGIAPAVIFVQCLVWGNLPFGSNPNDTKMADCDEALRELRASRGAGFIIAEARTDTSGNGPVKTWQLANPAETLTSDGRHYNANGCALLSSLVSALVTFTG